jgi:hypothetical protein
VISDLSVDPQAEKQLVLVEEEPEGEVSRLLFA